jgi:hypothetical protein
MRYNHRFHHDLTDATLDKLIAGARGKRRNAKD